MARRDPRSARLLGLWTAGWLFVLLLGGLLWLGDPSLQWPVLGVPVLWALVALRPRRRRHDDHDFGEHEGYGYGYGYGYGEEEDEDDWEPIPPPDRSAWRRPDLGGRTDTVERPAFRNQDPDDRY